MPSITLTGHGVAEPHDVVIPDDYSMLEELFVAIDGAEGVMLARVYAAMIGLCCPAIGRMCRVSYAAHKFGPVSYGREVYSWLHRQGVPLAEIVTAGRSIHPMILAAAFPRQAEVEEALGKSKAPAGG